MFKETLAQISSVVDFIEQIGGNINSDGTSSGNNYLKFISEKLKEVRNYPSLEVVKLTKTKELYLDLLAAISIILD